MFSNPYYGDHVDFDFDVFGQHFVLNCDEGSFLDALASLDFKLSVSQSVTFFYS